MFRFYEEIVTHHFFAEAKGLFEQHHAEVSSDKDLILNPDVEIYLRLAEIGLIKLFTVREASSRLVGYAAFFIKKNPHHSDHVIANQDLIYISKESRGYGSQFIKFCDEQLKEYGVTSVIHFVKVDHDWSPILKRIGYQHIEHAYQKRLDKGQ